MKVTSISPTIHTPVHCYQSTKRHFFVGTNRKQLQTVNVTHYLKPQYRFRYEMKFSHLFLSACLIADITHVKHELVINLTMHW